jgi:hypothetical protein
MSSVRTNNASCLNVKQGIPCTRGYHGHLPARNLDTAEYQGRRQYLRSSV